MNLVQRLILYMPVRVYLPFASISIPYTSTAFISYTYNIPTIYLDSTQMLDPYFKINKDIPLVSSKEELFNWFESINKKEYNN